MKATVKDNTAAMSEVKGTMHGSGPVSSTPVSFTPRRGGRLTMGRAVALARRRLSTAANSNTKPKPRSLVSATKVSEPRPSWLGKVIDLAGVGDAGKRSSRSSTASRSRSFAFASSLLTLPDFTPAEVTSYCHKVDDDDEAVQDHSTSLTETNLSRQESVDALPCKPERRTSTVTCTTFSTIPLSDDGDGAIKRSSHRSSTISKSGNDSKPNLPGRSSTGDDLSSLRSESDQARSKSPRAA